MSVLRLALVEVPDCCFLWRTARCWWAPGQRDELAQAAGSRRETERAAASLILSWRVPAVAGHRYAGACRPSSSWLTGARAWLFLSCIALLQACLPPGGLILYHVFHSTDRTHACVRQGTTGQASRQRIRKSGRKWRPVALRSHTTGGIHGYRLQYREAHSQVGKAGLQPHEIDTAAAGIGGCGGGLTSRCSVMHVTSLGCRPCWLHIAGGRAQRLVHCSASLQCSAPWFPPLSCCCDANILDCNYGKLTHL